jgi:hypothetical protein
MCHVHIVLVIIMFNSCPYGVGGYVFTMFFKNNKLLCVWLKKERFNTNAKFEMDLVTMKHLWVLQQARNIASLVSWSVAFLSVNNY